jgi:4-amino-4-deoxy-L-arabinose transferase-like glycosyltransferase
VANLTPRQWLAVALAATLAFRFWLAVAVPITGDEAYFIIWGRHPALGFYDHPPMVGWLLAPLVRLSEAAWVLRLPVLLLPALVALLVRHALVAWFERDEGTADLAAIAVLLVPANVWNVFITTDTPLILFSVASMLAFARERFVLAGALLGLAFLSKYFAVLLGIAYLAWAVAARRPRTFVLVFAAALPFGLVNLYWNWQACWCNVMFNAINRHEGAGLSWATPALYVASLAYLAGPLLWFAWKGRARLRGPAHGALLAAWLVPLVVFALISPVRRIGLHWLLSFVPAIILTVALALERRALVVAVRWFAGIALVQVAAVAVLVALPLETWRGQRFYQNLVLFEETPAVLQALEAALPSGTPAYESYSMAAVLSFHAKRTVPVFGPGSSHARHDDILTDWRTYEGRDLAILTRDEPDLARYRPYFRDVQAQRFEVRGAAFHAVLGRGLNYTAYREGVLKPVRERWYRIPPRLPVGACYFFERYDLK